MNCPKCGDPMLNGICVDCSKLLKKNQQLNSNGNRCEICGKSGRKINSINNKQCLCFNCYHKSKNAYYNIAPTKNIEKARIINEDILQPLFYGRLPLYKRYEASLYAFDNDGNQFFTIGDNLVLAKDDATIVGDDAAQA